MKTVKVPRLKRWAQMSVGTRSSVYIAAGGPFKGSVHLDHSDWGTNLTPQKRRVCSDSASDFYRFGVPSKLVADGHE
jgi:hypothetical protein